MRRGYTLGFCTVRYTLHAITFVHSDIQTSRPVDYLLAFPDAHAVTFDCVLGMQCSRYDIGYDAIDEKGVKHNKENISFYFKQYPVTLFTFICLPRANYIGTCPFGVSGNSSFLLYRS